MSRTVKAHILLLLVTFSWGVTFVVIKDALNGATPLLFNAIRMVVAAAALLLFYVRELPQVTPGTLRAGALLGTFLWLGYELQTEGLRLTTPSKSAFITGLSVVLVPLLMALFWRRRLRGWTWLGVLLALVGLYLMSVPAELGLQGINRGDVLTAGCALSFAMHIIWMGRATRQHRFTHLAVVQTVFCALLMVASVPLFERGQITWSPGMVWAIAVTALVCTAAAFTIQAWAQQFTSPTYTALIFVTEPVFAWITSFVVLGERLGWRGGAGAVLIVGGIVTAELKGGTSD